MNEQFKTDTGHFHADRIRNQPAGSQPPGSELVSFHAGTVRERIETGLAMFTYQRRAIHPLPGQ